MSALTLRVITTTKNTKYYFRIPRNLSFTAITLPKTQLDSDFLSYRLSSNRVYFFILAHLEYLNTLKTAWKLYPIYSINNHRLFFI